PRARGRAAGPPAAFRRGGMGAARGVARRQQRGPRLAAVPGPAPRAAAGPPLRGARRGGEVKRVPRPRQRRAPRRPRVRVKAPTLLLPRTQALIERIQKLTPGTFLTYWMSTSGSVCDNDVMAMHDLLQEAGPQQ